MIQSFIWLMIGHIEKHATLTILYFKMVYRTKSRVNWIQVCVCGVDPQFLSTQHNSSPQLGSTSLIID